MKIITQPMVYVPWGKKSKQSSTMEMRLCLRDGLSGSGKTFTVFGPDAPDAPEAWFKHMKPYDMGRTPNSRSIRRSQGRVEGGDEVFPERRRYNS